MAGAALPTVSSARGLVSAGRVSQLSPSGPAAVPTAGLLGRAQPQAFLLSDRFVEIVPHLLAYCINISNELPSPGGGEARALPLALYMYLCIYSLDWRP